MSCQRINCKNIGCKHNKDGICLKDSIEIDFHGKCNAFEKGILYYIGLVWDKFEQDMVPVEELTDDLRIGIHFVMRLYHIGFNIIDYEAWRMISLQKGKDGKPLTTDDIIEMDLDENEFSKILEEIDSGDFPKIIKKEPKTETKPFGWLSPTGDYTEAPHGNHEGAAIRIVKEKGFNNEWKETGLLARDFLTEVKGYCLIHNPTMDGNYIVTYEKMLTKAQREFLYGYFMDLGDRFKAEVYLQE